MMNVQQVEAINEKITRNKPHFKKDINEKLRKLLWTNITSERFQNSKTANWKLILEEKDV